MFKDLNSAWTKYRDNLNYIMIIVGIDVLFVISMLGFKLIIDLITPDTLPQGIAYLGIGLVYLFLYFGGLLFIYSFFKNWVLKYVYHIYSKKYDIPVTRMVSLNASIFLIVFTIFYVILTILDLAMKQEYRPYITVPFAMITLLLGYLYWQLCHYRITGIKATLYNGWLQMKKRRNYQILVYDIVAVLVIYIVQWGIILLFKLIFGDGIFSNILFLGVYYFVVSIIIYFAVISFNRIYFMQLK